MPLDPLIVIMIVLLVSSYHAPTTLPSPPTLNWRRSLIQQNCKNMNRVLMGFH
jgi:hypothetical protein